MIVVGIAGRAGCGKSAVARRLAQRDGVVWVDLDRVAWSTYQPGTSTFQALVDRFGVGIVAEDGSIDRRRLADAAFRSEQTATELDRLVHPAVVRALAEIRAAEATKRTTVLLVEGALLATSDVVDRSAFDAILWLDVDEPVRRERLRSAGRPEHASRSERLEPTGDVVRVDGSGPLDAVADRVWAFIERLHS